MENLNFHILKHKICEKACNLFLTKDYKNITIYDIANELSVAPEIVFKYFGTKEEIILFLYQTINTQWEVFVNDLPAYSLEKRFELALQFKLSLISPYRELLKNITSLLLTNSNIGVHSKQTQFIRVQGREIIKKIVKGLNYKSFLSKKEENFLELLYLAHWGILFLFIYKGNEENTYTTLRLFLKLVKKVRNPVVYFFVSSILKVITSITQEITGKNFIGYSALAKNILEVIYTYRKPNSLSETYFTPHLTKAQYFIDQSAPIHFILPAFPAKSPNKKKVLGSLPDLGEEIALLQLEEMCTKIQAIYKPGAHITICSDGRIFADLVGITDELVSLYIQHLKKMLIDLNIKHVDVINMEDLLPNLAFEEGRQYIITNFSESLENLKQRLDIDDELKNLFNGIHRFIVEDRLSSEPSKSKNSIKEESKTIALQVIQRSNAWTKFLTSFFPNSLRLSIHPHAAHTDKIGIKLTKAVDDWITPWHGTIVLHKNEYILMKKEEVEKMGATLILKNDQPYYYQTI